MRTLSTSVLALVLLIAWSDVSQAQFNKGGIYLGPNLTLKDPLGFGADIEFGVSDNVGIGGLIRYFSESQTIAFYGDWSWTVFIIQATGYYHFIPNDKIDPYLGARLGYAVYSYEAPSGYSASDNSGIYLGAAGGLRYFFTQRISGNASLEFKLAGEKIFSDDLGIMVGVDFTL